MVRNPGDYAVKDVGELSDGALSKAKIFAVVDVNHELTSAAIRKKIVWTRTRDNFRGFAHAPPVQFIAVSLQQCDNTKYGRRNESRL